MQESVNAFARDGVTVIRNVLDKSWLDRLAAAIKENQARPGPHGKNHAAEEEEEESEDGKNNIIGSGGGAYFGDYVNWQRFPDFRLVSEEGPLGKVAADLMQASQVQFFHEHVLVKEAGNTTATPWHQDMPYYCVDGEKTVSLWVPLDPVSKDVCPHFLRGSHLDKKLYTPRRFKTLQPLEGDMSAYEPFPDIDCETSDRIVAFDMQPGDVLAFDFHTLHNAPANVGEQDRRAVSFRFLGDGARYAIRPHEVSPPFPEMGLRLGVNDPLPENWFPVVFRR
jgi:ectoine hydroxylase-related dioxygenase (phytanoyl-CoA dioxygenase family)